MNNLSEKLARSYEAAEKSPSQQVESADQASAVQDLREEIMSHGVPEQMYVDSGRNTANAEKKVHILVGGKQLFCGTIR